MVKKQIEIYIAAALFNARETFFNSALVERLEDIGYKANFPQRDGFEFSVLTKTIAERFPLEKINSIVQNLIYFLDIGFFIPRSDVILANFDEPFDEGVITEVCYSKLIGKFTVGFRTDSRSPYGSLNDRFGGMHFFPVYQTDRFILQNVPSKKRSEGERQIKSLAKKVDMTIKEAEIFHQDILPNYATQNPKTSRLFEGARLLFNGTSNFFSYNTLERVLARYEKHEKFLEEIGPKT